MKYRRGGATVVIVAVLILLLAGITVIFIFYSGKDVLREKKLPDENISDFYFYTLEKGAQVERQYLIVHREVGSSTSWSKKVNSLNKEIKFNSSLDSYTNISLYNNFSLALILDSKNYYHDLIYVSGMINEIKFDDSSKSPLIGELNYSYYNSLISSSNKQIILTLTSINGSYRFLQLCPKWSFNVLDVNILDFNNNILYEFSGEEDYDKCFNSGISLSSSQEITFKVNYSFMELSQFDFIEIYIYDNDKDITKEIVLQDRVFPIDSLNRDLGGKNLKLRFNYPEL